MEGKGGRGCWIAGGVTEARCRERRRGGSVFFVCVLLINASAESQHCGSACLCVAPLTLVKAAGGLALNAECFTATHTCIYTRRWHL